MRSILFLLTLSSCFAETLIAVDRLDGGVSVIVPVRAARPGESEAQRLESIRLESWRPDYVSHTLIERETLPQDRYFRNAWRKRAQSPFLTVDRPAAEAIHRERLQREEDALISKYLDKHRLAEIANDQAEMTRLADKINRTRGQAAAVDLGPVARPDLPALKAARPAVFDETEP